MKAFTDINQSKLLAGILQLKSADMRFTPFDYDHPWVWDGELIEADSIPCWSLSALLEVLDYPQLSKDKLGSGKTGWMVSVYPNGCRYDSCWHENPVDACYEMIVKLHKQKLL